MCERIKSWQNATTAVEPGQVDHQVLVDQDRHAHLRAAIAAAVAAHLRVVQVDHQVVEPEIHAHQAGTDRLDPRIGRGAIAQETIVRLLIVHVVFLLVTLVLVTLVPVMLVLVLLLLVLVVTTVLLVVMIAMIVHAVPVLLAVVALLVLVVTIAPLVAMIVAQSREAMIVVMNVVVQMVSAATIATHLVAQVTIVVMIVANTSRLIVVMRVMRSAIRGSRMTSLLMTSTKACHKSFVRYLKDFRFLLPDTWLQRNAPWRRKILISQPSM